MTSEVTTPAPVEDSGESHTGLPGVVVVTDFGGYFESLVSALVARKHLTGKPFKHKKVVISFGPWRMYDVRYESAAGTLNLDFYSACRINGGPDCASDVIDQL